MQLQPQSCCIRRFFKLVSSVLLVACHYFEITCGQVYLIFALDLVVVNTLVWQTMPVCFDIAVFSDEVSGGIPFAFGQGGIYVIKGHFKKTIAPFFVYAQFGGSRPFIELGVGDIPVKLVAVGMGVFFTVTQVEYESAFIA